MRRSRGALAGLVLVVCLSGCGSAEQNYCHQLTQDQVAMSDMVNSSDPGAALLRGLPVLQRLSDAAPPDLIAQWQVFVNAVAGLQQALHAAGVKPDEFRHQRIPARITGQARADLVAAADLVSSPRVVTAANDIEQQARDVCKINLGV